MKTLKLSDVKNKKYKELNFERILEKLEDLDRMDVKIKVLIKDIEKLADIKVQSKKEVKKISQVLKTIKNEILEKLEERK